MKILPETPSVDFLRREAKTLLRAMRETDTSATLARSQQALAERYGFGSWAELKAEVERRRAGDPSRSTELAAEVAGAFGLGTPTGPLEHRSWSQTGEGWTLATDRGRFDCRTILDWISDAGAEDADRLRRAAIERGVRSAEAVRTPDGALIGQAGGRRWCVDRSIETGPAPALPISAALARNVGTTLATLHSLRLPTDRQIGPWLVARRDDSHWRAMCEAARSAKADWAPALEAALPQILGLSSVCTDAPGDAVQLCINDYGPGAVRTSAGDTITVVHWDFAGANAPSWEIGWMLHAFGVDHAGGVNPVAARALMEGYAGAAGAVPGLDPSIFTPAICGHLNWLAGRISGALDDSDPERRRRETLELRDLLAHPRTVDLFEDLLAAAGRSP